MLPNQIEVIDHQLGFAFCFVPKVASTTLGAWHTIQFGEEVSLQNRYLIDSSQLNFNNPVYALWRPPYERIFSGLHTGLNALTNWEVGLDVKKHKKEYIRQFDIWYKNGTFEYSAIEQNDIGKHTYLLQHIFVNVFDRVNFIHLDQIEYLHTYLNAKHNTNFVAIVDNLHKKEEYGTRLNMQPISLLHSLMYQKPEVYRALAAYAAQDYVPRKFLDISKFR